MPAIAGQAIRGGLRRGRDAAILAARVVLALLLLAGLGVGALAWRLSQGPLDLPWLARRVATAASGPAQSVSIGRLLVAWDGFSHPGAPLQLLLTGVHAAGGFGAAELERAEMALPLWPLLGGHVQPETADLGGLRLRLLRAAGAPGGPPGAPAPDPAKLLRQVVNPGATPDHPWASLRRLHLHDATAELSGTPGRVAHLDVDLDRPDGGGLTGRAVALLQAAGQQATMTLDAQVAPDGRGTRLQGSLTPISPAALAGASPQTAALAALDAPVTLSGNASLDAALELIRADADIAVGVGTIHAGAGTAPLLGADLHMEATPQGLQLTLTRLETAARPEAPRTRFSGHAAASPQAAGGYAVAASLDVDQVDFIDLPALWPEGTGGPGTRPWMTRNITAGRLTGGHVEMDLALPADLSDVALRRIEGGIDGHDLTVHWLRPVPPLEHGEARLTCTDPDVIDIAVLGAVQAGGSNGGLRYHDGSVHLTGIASDNQFAEIRTGLAGPLADLLTVLNNPRIKLLSKRPLPMRDPSGTITAQVHVGRLPLRDDVSMDDLVIDTTARTAHVHLGGIVAGYDLDDGALDLAANNDGLTIAGTAAVAGFASRLKLGMDFRLGPPTQVQQTVAAHSVIEMARLGKFGIHLGQQVGGSAALDATLSARRDGRMEIALAADLAQLVVAEPRLGIAKRRGEPGTAALQVVLEHDRLTALDGLRIKAPGIDVLGTAEIEAGRPSGLRLERLVLGHGTDLTGEIRMPGPGRPVGVRLSGPSLDLSPALHGVSSPNSPASSGSRGDGLGGRPWTFDLATDRLILGAGRSLSGVRATADSDGQILRSASVSAQVVGLGLGSPLKAVVAPDAGGRRLTVEAADAGALLQAAGVSHLLGGGRLRVVARWPDQRPDAPLAGVAELTGFRVLDAPSILRVLKALTLYGLVDLARGPGVGFTRLVAPFSMEREVLTLREARAVSPSLGFTAQGRIDLGRRSADLTGTVVPAYFFNSLLGRLPLVGGLFTSEKGGGLFAAAVGVKGPLDDLKVSVNPLSAIAPGILRGLVDGRAGGGP